MTTWKRSPWLALDAETTGVNVETDEPCEIGLVRSEWRDGARVITDRTQIRIRPSISIPAAASEIHGIRDADVADAGSLADAAPAIIAAIEAAPVVVTYNGYGYDLPMLGRLIPGFRDLFRDRACLDALIVVRLDNVGRFWKGKGRHRLANAARSSGLEVDEDRAHGAVYDCEMTTRILDRWCAVLPDRWLDAQRYLIAQKRAQDEDFRQWKARQPPRD